MLREGTLSEISDGRLYGLNDMVRADCAGCAGCSKCCRSDMGTSISLDPYDVWMLSRGTGRSFEDMVEKEIKISMLDGLALPHMNMEHGCQFLDGEGRCSIHPYRPSICRLFPLGRYYENGDFRYFLQVHECTKANRSKVKVQKWIDIDCIEEHTAFVRKWHNFLGLARRKVSEASDPQQIRNFMLFLLDLFYVVGYDTEAEPLGGEAVPTGEAEPQGEEAVPTGEAESMRDGSPEAGQSGDAEAFFRQFHKRMQTAVREMKRILR